MRAPLRLGLYGLTLAGVFAGSALAASAIVPDEVVTAWTERGEDHSPRERSGR